MIYKIRVILDAQEDIFRDLEIEATSSLEDLHMAITQSFGFLGEEMASFFTCDENWQQEEEIPLFDMRESEDEGMRMGNTTISQVLSEENPRMLYVYDFLNMWTFFVELADVAPYESGRSYPNLLFSFGEVPDTPPEKRFEAEPEEEAEDIDDAFGNYEDMDFDENWN
ncbi:IS1096 element passenger TnpR family protein [Robiginitalea sediminis]|uniref:IS1096 element passenger TnpR family protein n=1 Tax=Robiginitalea sediminis TaxID=1982593 RepID=UPI000B4B6919|nr:hypothetical protein [Robiginitalea sediminis]